MNDSCQRGAKVCSVSCCSLKIRRVEISVADGKCLFVKGQAHRAISNILIASKQTSIQVLMIGKREVTCLNRHVTLKQSLTDDHTAGRQSYRVK